MTLRITPFPEPRAMPPDSNPEAPRSLGGLSADLPAGGAGKKQDEARALEVPGLPDNPNGEPHDESLTPIIERLTRFKTTPSATAGAVAPEPFPPVEPPPPKPPVEPPTAPTPEAAAEPEPSCDREPAAEEAAPPPTAPAPSRDHSSPHHPDPTDDGDEALEEALSPIVERAVESALYGPRESLHTYLEPMLRQTVRRAIAEQLESARLFANPSLLDRLVWRLQALVSSRTYDEIVFDRTHRYQVEEIYLFSRDLRRLLSYASHDPAQHGSPRRVRPTVRVLRARIGDLRGKDEHAFDLPLGRLGLLREGKFTLLVAVLRGRSNSLIRADLDYLQFQIEERYGRQLRDPQNVFMHTLQPMLEGGLLIQAPPAEHS